MVIHLCESDGRERYGGESGEGGRARGRHLFQQPRTDQMVWSSIGPAFAHTSKQSVTNVATPCACHAPVTASNKI